MSKNSNRKTIRQRLPVAPRLKQDVGKRCTISANAGHAIEAMLKTFIEECGFAASAHESSRRIPDLIALA
jgi:hypothetical protein